MRLKKLFWPAVGLAAVAVSGWLLYHELRGISLDDVWDGLTAITATQWLLSALSAAVAYGALAGYDHIALTHLGKKVPWLFVTLCSFTTYALSHNIGGSVLSGAVIRYRAYGTRGLTGQEIGVLVALCSLTFALSCMLMTGLMLILLPDLPKRFAAISHLSLSFATGAALLILVAAYVFGSWLHLKPLKIGKLQLYYPSLPIVFRQLTIGPLEIVAAAALIYFALPAAGNPGFLVVLGVFVISFSAAQLSHAPGGLGVLEVVFLAGLDEMDPVSVLAALLVFRLLYFIIPFLLGLVVVLAFEKSQYGQG